MLKESTGSVVLTTGSVTVLAQGGVPHPIDGYSFTWDFQSSINAYVGFSNTQNNLNADTFNVVVVDSNDDEISPETPNWADSNDTGSEICTIPVEEWVETLTIGPNTFDSTEDVPLPNRLVDQVIGQDAASIVVREAAEQRRHVSLMGDRGTG